MSQQHGGDQGWNQPQADHSFNPGAQAYGQQQGAHNQPVEPYNQQPGAYGQSQDARGYGHPQGFPQQAYGQPQGYGQPQYGGPGVTAQKKTAVPGWILAGGGLLAFIGTFVPWASAGGFSTNGWDGSDGPLVGIPALVVVALGVVIALVTGRRAVVITSVVIAAVVLLLAILVLINVSSTVSDTSMLSMGAGPPLILLGALASLGGALWALVATKKR